MIVVCFLVISFLIAGASLIMGYLYWRSRLGRPAAGYIPILAYHKVDVRFELGGTWTTPRQFQRQMDFLKANGITTVTLTRAAELIRNGESQNRKYVCITFDDAYEGLYHHAWPILKKHGFSATIFVVTDFVGRENVWDVNWGGRRFKHLGWEQITEMAEDGIEFGSHGRSHQDLRWLEAEELKNELHGSKTALEDKLGKTITTLSYPFGRYDQRVIQAAIECGYRLACSLSPNIKNSQTDFMALRRSAVYLTDRSWDFRVKIYQEGRWFWLQDLWCRIVNFCAGGTILIQRAVKYSSRGK